MTPDEQSIALARIEVKLDTLIATNSDHEGRIRVLENRSVVTSKQLWATVVGTATVVGSAASLIYAVTGR